MKVGQAFQPDLLRKQKVRLESLTYTPLPIFAKPLQWNKMGRPAIKTVMASRFLQHSRTFMIIVLKPNSPQPVIDHVLERIRELGFKPHLSQGEHRTIVGVI